MVIWPRTWRESGGLVLLIGGTALVSLAFLQHTDAPIVLRVATAQRDDLITAITGTGTVQPRRTVDIKYDGQDFVDTLAASEGQRVARGQILARMNTQLLEHTRGQNVQVVARDDVNLALAAATLRRAEQLSAHQLLARADLDTAQSAYDALVHQRDADRQALLEVETQIERATLRSPLNGVVTQLYVHEGEMLGSATAVTTLGSAAGSKPTNVLMTLAQDGALEVWVDINAIDLGGVSIGQPAQIASDAFRPEVFSGHVRTIALQPTVINNVTTYQVKVEMSPTDPRWRIGMPVAVMLRRTLAPHATVIPLAALVTQNGHEAVRTIVQGQCDRGLADVPVNAFARNTQSVAVRGLSPGEVVVLSSETVRAGAAFQCQAVPVRANPTFDDLQFGGRATDTKAATLMPGPKPKGVLQRLFGV